MLYDLPMEILDIVLQKSYLHWILSLPTNQRDEEVISSLISVDVCFNKRIIRKRFKKAIFRYLKDFYGKTKKISAIIRNNRNYLLESIQPKDKLVASLVHVNCITDEQSHFIKRQHSTRDKNYELLYVVQSLDETKFSTFIKCLRLTNQSIVAKIMEIGGGVIKARVAKRTDAIEAKLLHQIFKNLQDKTKPKSFQIDKLVQLREEGIEILSSQLDRQTVVVWIWCRSQEALQYCQKLYECNKLRDAFLEIIQRPISMVIIIDWSQFKKTVVERPVFINFTQRIDETRGEQYALRSVTKLRNEIYVLCQLFSRANVIHVFDDRMPFNLQKKIEVKEVVDLQNMGSSEKDNCLYLSGYEERCVWKMTRETEDQHKIIKWLTIDYEPGSLPVSSDGQLLMINESSLRLMLYGSDAELIRSIPLPKDIKQPHHALKTSVGNFVVVHTAVEKVGEMERDSAKKEKEFKEWVQWTQETSGRMLTGWDIVLVVSMLTRDGETVIRRRIPSDESRHGFFKQYHLSLDSDDRVFLADADNGKVILLDSDLHWNRILCPTTEEKNGTRIGCPFRLFYDEQMKQLIVVGTSGNEINVYTLCRN